MSQNVQGKDSATALEPLRGMRVLDASRYAPGPFCSRLLQGLGAEIWKLEVPSTGDPLRDLDRDAFGELNAGKKSATLNLKSTRGKELFIELASRIDVFIEGFRPGVMARLGLDYPSLQRRAPELVYVSISGYGQDGPYRDRAGHDVNYMAAAGALAGVKGPLPLQVADFAAGGLYAALAIVSALLARHRESEPVGRYLDVAMLDGVRSFMSLATGTAYERLSGRYPNYGLYQTGDGHWLSVGALEPVFWKRLCDALDLSHLADRMDESGARADVAARIAEQDKVWWQRKLSDVDCCAEWVLDPEEAASHPQELFRKSRSRALPFLAVERGPGGDAPGLGEHTRMILRELDVDDAEFRRLQRQGVC